MALDSRIYERLAQEKRESESFTKVIDRLLQGQAGRGTCGAAVLSAAKIWGSDDRGEDADCMEALLDEGRRSTDWEAKPLE